MTSKYEEMATLYLTERERLHRQINRRVGCAATAYDLVQDIFLRLWERSPLRTDNDAAYLSRCARNAAIDHLRAQQTRRSLENGLLPEQYATASVSPQEILEARQGIRSIDEALAVLPKQTRHIFLLNRVHARTFAEIAAAMGISQRAVAKHMARAVAACQKTLVD
ncbi:RNA polymerase sigma factor [Shinella sp. HZN7]|uniref:RNA polymerase sigma factor n=1 Tax=Shinella sp. (strain HZN7) TaxID=879274 RepID=UPI0007DA93CB|nr:sigma-70 family RNA polymerase sigma factor [Shinella sp. HZN7]ANH03406.1 RNA polymerase subunit sigma-70 [Shinella sp. HZN7]